jgi:two-component system nitrate/nitrite response regulator NarL
VITVQDGGERRDLVLVVAREPLLCDGLAATLARRSLSVECSGTVVHAARLLDELKPRWSVIVLDPPLPDASVGSACETLIGRHPDTAAVVLLRGVERTALTHASGSGARGLLNTAIGAGELVHALEQVAAGVVVVDPSFFAQLAGRTAWPPSASHSQRSLTHHQLRALRLVADGNTSKEIARSMRTTPTAVDHTVERAAERLGAANRAHAVARAMRLGLLG